MLGHGLAIDAMRGRGKPGHQFGITLNLSPTDAASDAPEDVDAARRADGLANRLFLDPLLKGAYPADVLEDVRTITDCDFIQDGDEQQIEVDLDFLGVNYYFRTVVRKGEDAGGPTIWPGNGDIDPVERGLPKTEMGWEIDADGLYDILTRVARDYPGVPLYVTENGAAFADVKQNGAVHDPDRVEYLRTHFGAAQRAIADGVDLRGYFVWSLLDNFEWAYGFSKRFGLIHVDYETLERTPKDSASFYAAGHAGERRAGVVSTRSWPTSRSSPTSWSVRRPRMSAAEAPIATPISPACTIRRRSTVVNAVRSACSVNVTRAALARLEVDAREARQPGHRARHRRDGVRQVELDDLGSRPLAGVGHDARDLDLAVGGELDRPTARTRRTRTSCRTGRARRRTAGRCRCC